MARPGWIKLYYSLLENPMWEKDKPFTEGQAWIDLLLLAANWKHDVNGVELEPGTVYLSNQQLMKRWGWTRYRLDKTLASWEEQKMVARIHQKTDEQGFQQGFRQGVFSPLTIVKWDFFQGSKRKNQQGLQQGFQQQPKNIYKNSDGSGVKNPRPHARKKPPVGGDVELVKVNGEWVAKPR